MSWRSIPIEGEPRWPAGRHLEQLDAAGGVVRPESEELVEWFETYRGQHRERLARDLGLVERFATPAARLLEVGASPFLLTAALVSGDYEVCAIDLAPERFASTVAELELDVRRCDIEREPLPVADGSCDLVLFNELFEHLHQDPIFALREVLRVLDSQGCLLLSTPNLRSFRGLKNLWLHHQAHAVSGGVFEQWDKRRRLGHMGHVREYTGFEVLDFLERIGFAIDRLIYRGGHGRGVVGWAERLVPSMRPFLTVVARPAARAVVEPGS